MAMPADDSTMATPKKKPTVFSGSVTGHTPNFVIVVPAFEVRRALPAVCLELFALNFLP